MEIRNIELRSSIKTPISEYNGTKGGIMTDINTHKQKYKMLKQDAENETNSISIKNRGLF
jgi:hypothetical protein